MNAIVLVGVLVSVIAQPVSAAATAEDDEEAKLIATLRSDAPRFEKAKACQRLGVIGTGTSVPVLADLLGDPELAHYARFGLEPNPDPSVDDAFRAALDELEGDLLVGVINSMGARRNPAAVEALAARLGDSDERIALAAAAAIGRIGSAASAGVLKETIGDCKGSRRVGVALAILSCAEVLVRRGQKREGLELYDMLRRDESLPKHVRLPALRGAIVSRGSTGVPILARAIRAEDEDVLDLALLVTHDVPGQAVTEDLTAALSELPPTRRALAIAALAERRDAGSAGPEIRSLAQSGPRVVRIAAVHALQAVGDASAVPILLRVAEEDDAELVSAAWESLENLSASGVDDTIVALLEDSDGRTKATLITLAGRRRIAAAVPLLRAVADGEDTEFRLLAIEALGKTVPPDELDRLADRLAEARAEEERAVACAALKVACARVSDQTGCAETLRSSMEGAPRESKSLFLEVLGSVGGARALELVVAHAGGDDADLRAVALRVLGEWPSEEAAGALVELVESETDAPRRLEDLAAFRQLVSSLGFDKERRLGVCRRAMDAARDRRERAVVLTTYAAIPAPETLVLLRPHLDDPALAEVASAAVVKIAERIARSKPDAVIPALRKVLAVSADEPLKQRARGLLRRAGAKP